MPTRLAYLQAVGHDDHAGVRQGAEQLLRGAFLLLPVVLLLRLGPGNPVGGSREKALSWPLPRSSCQPASPPGLPLSSLGRGEKWGWGGGQSTARPLPLAGRGVVTSLAHPSDK